MGVQKGVVVARYDEFVRVGEGGQPVYLRLEFEGCAFVC